jgi:hypothetical protein
MLFLLTIHLSMNYAAVRAVSMRSLNRQRANIVLSHLILHDKVPTPQHVSKCERIFERDGVLRWNNNRIIGRGHIGVSLGRLIGGFSISSESTGAIHLQSKKLFRLLSIYKDEGYVLWFDLSSSTALIALKQGSSSQAHLKAWCQGLLIAKEVEKNKHGSHADVFTIIADTLVRTTKLFEEYPRRLGAEGWDLNIAALETHSGRRLRWKQEGIAFHQQKGE